MSARAAHRGLRSTSGVLAPADRHFRRPDVRPGRRRRLGQRLWQAARLSGAALVAAAAVLWVGQAVLGSSLLDVDRVIVRGNQRLSAADVDALLVDLRGRHILEVNLAQYQRRLLESPWIASVTLWRLLPSTVEVSVVERRPIATARLGDQLYLVDADGVIVDEFGPQYRDLDLPIVDGLMRRPGDGASIVDQDRVALTTRLLASLDSRPDLARRLSQVDTTNLHDVVVLLDGDTALLHLGDGQFVERLTRYLELAPALGESFVDIDYVDLRFERLFVKAAGRAEADAVVRRP
jgi:cell division septal protein FtsQ